MDKVLENQELESKALKNISNVLKITQMFKKMMKIQVLIQVELI